jgi:hypothetical protein
MQCARTGTARRSYRTWVGADLAPTAALKFGAAVMRLLGADAT